RWGHPDGQQAMNVGIALPKFMLDIEGPKRWGHPDGQQAMNVWIAVPKFMLDIQGPKVGL
ncbi:unnamed protein product, partial [Closterium sp. NIES-54]